MSKTKYIAYDSKGKILHQYEQDTESLLRDSSAKENILRSWKSDKKVVSIKVDEKRIWKR